MNLRSLIGAIALTLPTLAQAAPVAGIEWNGFGSAYVAKSFAKSARPSILQDSSVDPAGLSLLGLNLKATVENDITASAQLVARTRDLGGGYLNAKWFYLTWTPMTDLHVKAGRQVYPLFMNSENADVRAALPYTRIPDELTALAPFESFDGLSADHTYRLSQGLALGVAVEGGRSIYARNTIDNEREAHDLAGINVGLTGAWWTVSLHASRVGFTAMDNTTPAKPETSLANYTAGVKAERWNFLLQAEGLHQETNKGNADGGYAMLGYKWNGWMPRYTYAFARSKALMQGETMTHNLGVNHQIGQRLIAKLDVQFSQISKERGGVAVTTDPAARKDNAGAALVGLDFLF